MHRFTFEQKRTLLRWMIITPEIVDASLITGFYLVGLSSLFTLLLLLMAL